MAGRIEVFMDQTEPRPYKGRLAVGGDGSSWELFGLRLFALRSPFIGARTWRLRKPPCQSGKRRLRSVSSEL